MMNELSGAVIAVSLFVLALPMRWLGGTESDANAGGPRYIRRAAVRYWK